MALIIDGKKISDEIRKEIKDDLDSLRKRGILPHLSVILVGDNPASHVYVRMKEKACTEIGISSETLRVPETVSQSELIGMIDDLNGKQSVNGILVQLPLPSHINENIILERILPDKDVDGFHPVNMGKLAAGIKEGFIPATPAGIVELLMRTGNYPEGKNVVIVGRSNIVGKPVGLLLLHKAKYGNATVTFCHSKTRDLKMITKSADILIAAIGIPEMITKEMIKPGAVVIDVGVNRVEDKSRKKGYRLVGDVKFDEVSKIASAITPVPGGVGPMTITMLLRNTLKACKKSLGEQGRMS